MSPDGWVIGRGLLGSAVLRRLGASGFYRSIDWSERSAAGRDLVGATADFLDAGPLRQRTIYWCAGSGVTSTAPEVLEQEVEVFTDFLRHLEGLPAEDRIGLTVFLASSVGGTLAGNPEPPFTERSFSASASPYGDAKLAMERALRDAAERAGFTAFIGRISNIYGPGQNLGKAQGLISVICGTYLQQRSATIYVSMDTIRDYIYEDDCAAVVVEGARLAASASPGVATTKIIASERAISIGELVGEIHRVMRRRPLIAIAAGNARGQAPDLRVRSVVMPELARHVGTPLAVGIHRTFEAMRRSLAAGS